AGEYRTIDGTLMRVSDPRAFTGPDGRVKSDYFYLGIKTRTGDRVMVYITTSAMGWGSFQRSRVWYFNEEKGREIKTSLANPSRFLGKRFRVTGALEVLNAGAKKFRMNRVQKVVVYP
ncbi:MAG: hypothetical protein ACTSU5_16000, partial [Promethearchaeota archaeon]